VLLFYLARNLAVGGIPVMLQSLLTPGRGRVREGVCVTLKWSALVYGSVMDNAV
jgi:hypothetical protein